MPYTKKPRAPTRRRAPARRPRMARTTNTKAIRTIVKKEIGKRVENKWVGAQYNYAFNSRISGASECYPLMPAIARGPDSNMRIGQRVSGKYLYVKGFVQWDTNSIDQQGFFPPATARLMILSQKNLKVSTDIPTRVDVAHLLKDNVGTGAARPYLGGIFDNLAPINKDLFVVHLDKKIRFKSIRLDTQNVDEYAGTQPTHYFRCRIKLPSQMTFDDGNLDYPNDFAPFVCFGAVYDDNQAAANVTTPWRMAVQSVAYYEDA